MAFRKMMSQRFFNVTKTTNCRVASSYSIFRSTAPANPGKDSIAPDPGDKALFRRFLHREPVLPLQLRCTSVSDNLVDIAKDRFRLDFLAPPVARESSEKVRVEDVKKLLRLAQLEAIKMRLRTIEKNWIDYPEFVRICGEGCLDAEQGLGFAKVLEEAGNVIVLRDLVFHRPEKVNQAIQSLIQIPGQSQEGSRKMELGKLEKQKAEIDKKAESHVHRELQWGLGFLVIQTGWFMRLTFWDLSWDVMEPICFFVTSMYFMVGYAFFLRTSKEPSFEGFFQSRFRTKQRKLMEMNNFDLTKYNELRKALYPREAVLDGPGKIQFRAVNN